MMKLQKISNTAWLRVSAVVAFLGFLDSAFLTVKHYVGGTLPCLTSGSCEVVTTSTYSMIYGVPVALLGALYYIAMFVLILVYLDSGKEAVLRLSRWLVRIGLVMTIWFVFVQIFILHAICLYCMGSALSTTILFILSVHIQRSQKLSIVQ